LRFLLLSLESCQCTHVRTEHFSVGTTSHLIEEGCALFLHGFVRHLYQFAMAGEKTKPTALAIAKGGFIYLVE
jgi:hypothetical protein